MIFITESWIKRHIYKPIGKAGGEDKVKGVILDILNTMHLGNEITDTKAVKELTQVWFAGKQNDFSSATRANQLAVPQMIDKLPQNIFPGDRPAQEEIKTWWEEEISQTQVSA